MWTIGIKLASPTPARCPYNQEPERMTATVKVEALTLAESLKAAEEVDILPTLAELNIFRTLLRHPQLAKVVSELLMMLLSDGNKLDPRLRELLIMRIGWVTSCDYEWTQHWPIAKLFGINEDHLLAVRDWQNADCFDAADRAVLAATDDTLQHGRILDPTWDACMEALEEPEVLLELSVAIGAWRLISQLARSTGVKLEEGVESWPPDGQFPAQS
jgi:alkylhydroperoxidase family enzyme